MDIYERITVGMYENKLEYPGKPKPPKSLSKVAKDLTDQEIRMIPLSRDEYNDAIKDWQAKLAAYNAETARLTDLFYADMCDDFGVPPDDLFIKVMYAAAWQAGHANGFGNVVSEFSDLMPLWELYEKKGAS